MHDLLLYSIGSPALHRTILFLAILATAGCRGKVEEKVPQNVPGTHGTETTSPDMDRKKTDSEKIIVYYFHTTFRCQTCSMFENVTEEIVVKDFGNNFEDGSLEFKAVNVEDASNKHFIDHYRLHTRAVIISHVSGERESGWTNLDKIWELARNRDKLRVYIRDNIAKHLQGLNG